MKPVSSPEGMYVFTASVPNFWVTLPLVTFKVLSPLCSFAWAYSISCEQSHPGRYMTRPRALRYDLPSNSLELLSIPAFCGLACFGEVPRQAPRHDTCSRGWLRENLQPSVHPRQILEGMGPSITPLRYFARSDGMLTHPKRCFAQGFSNVTLCKFRSILKGCKRKYIQSARLLQFRT